MDVQGLRKIALTFVGSTFLVSCGGGGSASGGAAPPPAPPPITKAEAYRFLTQATFGPTEAEAQRVITLGYEAWIDEQLGLLPTRHLTYLRSLPQPVTQNDRVDAWFQTALLGRDQLRQRMAFALSQIWVVSENSALFDQPLALAQYYDLLADGAFGNYRALMENVTLTPQMGVYLSMLGNEKPNRQRNIRPDENYARELMQLFTIGLVELEIDGRVRRDANNLALPTYDQAVIEGFAHVFTGWTFGGSAAFQLPSFDWLRPMEPFEAFHDTASKQLLRGAVVAAGGTARSDLAAALDNLFGHPNVGPFIAKQLIQRFVSSNPSPGYVQRVAAKFNDNGRGTRGDMSAVIKAILLDAEARNSPTAESQGKIKEPLLRLTAFWRAYGARASNGRYALPGLAFTLGQGPLQAPSVFNFFRPEHMPAGELTDLGLVAPEMQITHELTSALTAGALAVAIFQWNNFATNLPPDAVIADFGADAAAAADPAQLVRSVTERLLGAAPSSEFAREAEALARTYPSDQAAARALEVAYLLLTSAEFAVQR